MKKIKETFASLLTIVIIFVLGAGAMKCYEIKTAKTSTEIFNNQENDVKLPGEQEKTVVTINDVEAKLVEIQELSTYSGKYTVTKGRDYFRTILDDLKIPLTTNNVTLECEGIVKVGYDVKKIGVNIDNKNCVIYISLPEASVNDNYVIWDTIKCKEGNNVLNPIDFEQYKQLIEEIEEDGLMQVEKEGIYIAAQENIKKIITGTLAGIDNYEVKFV